MLTSVIKKKKKNFMPMTPSGGGQKDYYAVYHPILGNPQQITLRNSQLIIL
jgi:hypothetical protein